MTHAREENAERTGMGQNKWGRGWGGLTEEVACEERLETEEGSTWQCGEELAGRQNHQDEGQRESGLLVAVQSLSRARLLVTPRTAACQDSLSSFPAHHLLQFAQTHVHWVDGAIQPSHPLPSPSPPALRLSQHQGLFQWVRSSDQAAKGLALQLQHQSFHWIFRVGLL